VKKCDEQELGVPIPPIADYSMPVDLPTSRLDWTLRKDRAALLVHDMQRYFLDPYEGTELLAVLQERVRQLVAWARASDVPVVFTGQPARQDASQRGLNLDLWGPGMQEASCADILLGGADPAEGDVVIMKRRYSAFHGSDLSERMAAWGRDQLVVAGVYANYGCLMTAQHAFMHDIQPFVAGDAMADFRVDEHHQALRTVVQTCGVVLGTAELVAS
jgi:bifunctional isochorismate lyase / aryl carrier protein